MPSLVDDGSKATPIQGEMPRYMFPMGGYQVADTYARLILRKMKMRPPFTPSVMNRTSYTNLLTYSEDFTNAAWTKAGLTVTADVATLPNGTSLVDKLSEDAATSLHLAYYDLTVTAGATYNITVFAKAVERSLIQVFSATTGVTSGGYANFDLSSGKVTAFASSGGGTVIKTKISRMDSGWFRCEIAITPTAGTTLRTHVCLIGTNAASSTTPTYAGTAGFGVYVGGVQVVAGSMSGPYIPTTSLAVAFASAPEMDIGDEVDGALGPDPFAFLLEETDPQPSDAGTVTWDRLYGRIPANQTYYSSRAVTKPPVPNQASNTWSVRAFPTTTTESTTAYRYSTGFYCLDYRLFTPFVASGNTILVGYATAGTFTVTYKTSTTAVLNYSDSSATIQAAINALAAVISDGLTVTTNTSLSLSPSGFIQLTVTVGSTTSPFTLNPASLTVNTSKKAFTTVLSSTSQYLKIANHITVVAHGASPLVPLLVVLPTSGAPSTYKAVSLAVGEWGSADANTIQLPHDVNAVLSGIVTHIAPYLRTYTPGVAQVTTRITERYYIAGISTGITTASDIPLYQTVLSEASFLAALFSGGGYQTIDFQGPETWHGPLLRTVQSEINLTTI